jgi:CBS domain-containing protein
MMHGEAVMKVKDVMHKGVTWVAPATPLSKIARKMRTEDIGAVPVGENDRLVGMVTDRDICCRGLGNGRDIKKLTARDVMTKPILYCTTDQDVKAAIAVMKKSKVRRLPVINAKKRMVGMLSLGDISAKSTRETSGIALKALAAHHA